MISEREAQIEDAIERGLPPFPPPLYQNAYDKYCPEPLDGDGECEKELS
jgi:hypothetical protein